MYRKESYVHALIRTTLDAVISIDHDQNIIVFNPAAEHIFGYRAEEVLGKQLDLLIPVRFRNKHKLAIEKFDQPGVQARSMYSQGELLGVRKSGEEFAIEASISKLKIEGKIVFTAILRDISERRRLEHELRKNEIRLNEIFENLSSGVAIYRASPDGQHFYFTALNRSAEQIEQVRRQDVIGKNVQEVFPGVVKFGLSDVFRRVWQTGKSEHVPTAYYSDQRISGWRENHVYKLSNGEVVAIYNDRTEEMQEAEKMRQLAYLDQLTGLPNRTLLWDRLQQSLIASRRDKKTLAVIFIDLDRFKPVNDQLGHDIGDLLLITVAERMRRCIRESDTLSRLGGDEFVALLPSLKSKSAALSVAEKLLATIKQPYILHDHPIEISASIGLAFYPRDGRDEQTLLKHADSAMYQAKNNGRNGIVLYGTADNVISS